MYKVAFVDDSQKLFNLFSRRIRRIEKNIELILVEDCTTCEDISEWIINNNIECLLVDYKLIDMYIFNGTSLINYLNSKIPAFPCIVLTSYPEDAEEEKLVMKPLIFDKNVINQESNNDNLRDFITLIIHSVEVFRKRLIVDKERYGELLEKSRKSELTSSEYEELEVLFKLLKSYGIIDDISVVCLDKKINDKMDSLIDMLDKLIDK